MKRYKKSLGNTSSILLNCKIHDKNSECRVKFKGNQSFIGLDESMLKARERFPAGTFSFNGKAGYIYS